jgi:vacuolar-type H+-ATPase subunit E/Vma4
MHLLESLPCCSEYSKTLNEARLKVLAAREAAIQTVVKEARGKVREAAKNPNAYKKMMQDLLVQVRLPHVHRLSSGGGVQAGGWL